MTSGLVYWLYVDASRQWRWYLQAANGRKLADSGEGYNYEQDCIHAINLVAGSNGAPIKRK
jgi:uncharacterized protein